MNIKMSKNIMLIGAVILVLILGAIFLAYQYNLFGINKSQTENQEVQNVPDFGTTSASAFLMVCVDKCGDNVCQDTVSTCQENDLNCTCQETKQECPQDCK